MSTTRLPELKPCPFCGSTDAKITHDHGTYEPGCTHCGTYIGCYSSERSAAAAWNRRPADGLQHVGWLTQAATIVTPVGHREVDARLYGWEPVYRRSLPDPSALPLPEQGGPQ